ncbi:MAG: CerR family C-terminal domain-containing protein [Rhizobiales bacterium]|nr:CerR family C-terminal domain-containing protein [Hyphomicrobiales bacterium]
MGFDGTSTRDIARASGTAMSSITYHFGGKEGLYLACADHIAQGIRERHATSIDLMLDAGTLDRPTAVQRCLAIVDSFAQIMLHSGSERWARFIVREQQAPTEAFERLYQGVMKDMIEGFCALLAVVKPELPPLELRALAMLIFGQTLVLRAARASVCKALGTPELGDTEAQLLRNRIRENSLAILNGGIE